MAKKAIGIDLGSTMSEVCVMEGGHPTIVLTAEGSKTFPSVVNIGDDGERKVGAPAKRQMLMKPKQTVNLIKRLIGRTWEEAQDAIKHLQYEVVNHDGFPYVKINDREYSPQEISSWILAELKKMAEGYLGTEVTDAVITVPALFDDAQRNATKEAGELANLNVLRIINEPTAACLASKLDKSGKYAVVDFGGSTTDVTVLDYDKDTQVIEVLSSYGDTWLGGADLDNAVAQWIVDEFKKQEDVDISKDTMAMQRIIEAAEKAKIELSSTVNTEINLPYLTAVDGMPKHFIKSINKATFENIVSKYIDKVVKCAEDAVKKADTELDGIILVGGSCRVPLLQQRLTETFNVELIHKADLDTAVAEGAAIQANTLVGGEGAGEMLLLDVTPLTLGIETVGGVMTPLVEANTTIPTKKTQIFSTAVDNQPAVTINVLQGERPLARDNKSIGLFNLDGIAPARRGVPQIEVIFEVTADGIVSVTAIDKATKKEQHITIENKNSLSKEEIDRIKREAEEHAEEDKKTKEKLETANKCESLIYSTEQMIESMKDNVTEEDKSFFNEQMDKLKEMKEKDDYTGFEDVEKEVQERWYSISAKAYSQGQGAQGGSGGFSADDLFKSGAFSGATQAQPTEEPKQDNDVEIQDAE